MLELIVYPKDGNPRLIDPSPFCSKSEIFLKMAKIEFKMVEFTGNPGKFPNKKLPVIQHKGKVIADSSKITEYINKEFNLRMDKHLSPQLYAQGFAFSKMLEEYFYWSLLHERWFIDSNWIKLRDGYFGHMPKLIRTPIAGLIRKSTKKSAYGHGMSRHSDRDILDFGKETLKVLSDFLDDKKYLLGDEWSSFDATCYAFVASILHSPLGPVLKNEAEKYKNLREYDERMFNRVYPNQT